MEPYCTAPHATHVFAGSAISIFVDPAPDGRPKFTIFLMPGDCVVKHGAPHTVDEAIRRCQTLTLQWYAPQAADRLARAIRRKAPGYRPRHVRASV